MLVESLETIQFLCKIFGKYSQCWLAIVRAQFDKVEINWLQLSSADLLWIEINVLNKKGCFWQHPFNAEPLTLAIFLTGIRIRDNNWHMAIGASFLPNSIDILSLHLGILDGGQQSLMGITVWFIKSSPFTYFAYLQFWRMWSVLRIYCWLTFDYHN